MNPLILILTLIFGINLINSQRNNDDDSCPRRISCSWSMFRTIDGSCNNFRNPNNGRSNFAYRRDVQDEYANFDDPRGGFEPSSLPNERLISTTLHSEKRSVDRSYSQMLMYFGQYMTHDLMLSRDPPDDPPCCTNNNRNERGVCIPVRVPRNDSIFQIANCFEGKRNSRYCPRIRMKRNQINQHSAYLDASMVYAATDDIARRLRTYSGGRLRNGRENMLPLAKDIGVPHIPVENSIPQLGSGDIRVNQNPGLAALHTVWVREHNRIADGLRSFNNNWNDERLFQEARRIAIAEFQNVMYAEYLQALFPPEYMRSMDLNRPPTYNDSIDAGIDFVLAGGALRMGHAMVIGRVNRAHNGQIIGSYNLKDIWFQSSRFISTNHDLGTIIEGLSYTTNGEVDPFLANDVRNHFPGFRDLASINIMKGRDFGVPNYNRLRTMCGQRALDYGQSAASNGMRNDAFDILKQLYRNPNDIDLFPGTLSELHLRNGLMGRTLTCIISDQFVRLISGDRFFFTHTGNQNNFNANQIQHIRQRRFFDIICDNTQIQSLPRNVFRNPNRRRDYAQIMTSTNSRNVLNFSTIKCFL